MKTEVNEDYITFETAGGIANNVSMMANNDEDYDGRPDGKHVFETAKSISQMNNENRHVDEASKKKDRNDITESLKQFRNDLQRRMAGESCKLGPASVFPNSRRTSLIGSILTSDTITCLSDGDDQCDEKVSEMMLQISNHYETPRKDVAASLKAFHLDIEFVKNSEGHKDLKGGDEDYSEALQSNADDSSASGESFAGDSVASPSPKSEYAGMPSTSTAINPASIDVSFPPAPPLTDTVESTRIIDYSALSLKALKVELQVCGVSTAGFLEKSDFVKALEDYKQADYENKILSEKTVLMPSCSNPDVERETVGVCSPSVVPLKKYVENENVLYVSSDGQKESATILKVHLDDDLVPFYDIRLHSTGREKQTDDEHLELVRERKNRRAGQKKRQPPRRRSTTSSRSSTEYSLTSESTGYSLMCQANPVQKRPSKAKNTRSMDGLSLSAHSACSQRSTEQLHRRNSMGAFPLSMRSPKPRKSSSIQSRNPQYRRAKSMESAGMAQPTVARKRRSSNGLSLSAHSACSQPSTEQLRRRNSMGAFPISMRSPKPRKPSSIHHSKNPQYRRTKSMENAGMAQRPKVVRKRRSSNGLSLSAHSASSQRSTTEQSRRRRSMSITSPKSFLSPNPRPRTTGRLSLPLHSVSPRNSAGSKNSVRKKQVCRTKSVDHTENFFSPGSANPKTRPKLRRLASLLSLSQHSTSSHQKAIGRRPSIQ